MSKHDKTNSVVSSPEPSGRRETDQDTETRRNCLGPDQLVKASNPKDAIGCSKVPWSVLPTPVMGEVALAMLEGACKYARHNYREIGVRASIYYDAVVGRHLAAWWEGEDVDADSGLSHLVKAMAGLAILRDAQIRGLMTDDRPPGTMDFVKAQNDMAAKILAKYPDPLPAVTHEDCPSAPYSR